MRLKLISLLFIPFGLVLLMSHNTNASTTVNLTSFNGFYGYRSAQNTVGRNVNLTGSFPLETLTSTTSFAKELYGVGNKINFNFDTGGARYDVVARFVLSQKFDSYYLDTPQSSKTSTWTLSDGTTQTTYCTVNYEYNDVDTYFVIFRCPYSGAKRPTSVSYTLGLTQGFTVGTTSPIMYTPTVTNKSVYIYSADYNYDIITNDQQGVIDELGNIDDTLNEQFDKENQAVDNIENQTPPASGSGENSTTSSLLDTLGSFLTAITNLSATNCDVVLAFPAFAGGSQTVNICQNKEYTGNIVSVAGSIILVLFYLPVAFMLVNKIYSEIRSFTNG